MAGIYYPELLDVLRAAGCTVAESSMTNGWQTRARSSGGFPSAPLCVFWHHTASQTSPANDLAWCIKNCDDAPVGNMLLDRTGTYWPIAAGASNCAGKGGPSSFSRGTIPQDQGNTRGWQIEVANNGVGEPWPQIQIDAYFRGSNALNAHVGNLPTDVIGHAHYTPGRKIDPATASAVLGPWVPRSINSSGTWHLDDIRGECANRAGTAPPIPPDPPQPPTGGWWTDVANALPVLTPGMSGDFVLRMQHLMCSIGAMNESNMANYDGVFGNGTTNALNKWKSLWGSPDSTCDAVTWGALMGYYDANTIPNLKLGDSGPFVKRMQHLLAAGGFMNYQNLSNYDGVWGNGTNNAKRNFDNSHGLGSPSGDTGCGSKSWTSLVNGKVW